MIRGKAGIIPCRLLWMLNVICFLNISARYSNLLDGSFLQIPTSDVDISVQASSPLLKTPDKTGTELEETKLALKELQRHFETYKAERSQAEE